MAETEEKSSKIKYSDDADNSAVEWRFYLWRFFSRTLTSFTRVIILSTKI